jgi:hypothetical protein
MDFQVDIWLRGDNHATTAVVPGLERPAADWTDDDVRFVLEGMLRAMDRQKNPEAADDRLVQLRGLSWIVNPFEEGGVVIAIEITLGAAIAGPFRIEAAPLEAMIRRVLAAPSPAAESIH